MAKKAKARSPQDDARSTRFDIMIGTLKNHPVSAAIVVLGAIIIAIGSTTDALSKITEFVRKVRTANEPTYAELVQNVAKYVIDAKVERVGYEGPVVITPVGLFGDPGKLADGTPTNYTYLLCRVTNMSDKPVTIGALVDETNDWYRLDDPGLGYQPTLISLAQLQMFFRGRPMQEATRAREINKFAVDEATILPHATKYAYVNSLGSAWPKEVTLTIIDVTDMPAGSARIAIDAPNLSFPATTASKPVGRPTSR